MRFILGVQKVHGRCAEGARKVHGRCTGGARKVRGRCTEGACVTRWSLQTNIDYLPPYLVFGAK